MPTVVVPVFNGHAAVLRCHFYVNLIEGGQPKNSIINNFFASPEYHGRFLP